MEPIDLTTKPPRRPRAELAGILFLPRSIDKARAALPGGNLGQYQLPGWTQRMLDQLGIMAEAFTTAVATAALDEDVAAFVQSNTAPEKIAAWNEVISKALPRNGDRAAALQHYPWLSERPDLILVLDVLEEDDQRSFVTQ